MKRIVRETPHTWQVVDFTDLDSKVGRRLNKHKYDMTFDTSEAAQEAWLRLTDSRVRHENACAIEYARFIEEQRELIREFRSRS